MIGLLVIMGIICSSALALITMKTAPIIAEKKALRYKGTILEVFGSTGPGDDSGSITDRYAKMVEEQTVNGLTLLSNRETGDRALSLVGSGFQGLIHLVVALDGERISGFKVVSQEETPGLGSRITDDAFQKSFIGKRVAQGITMTKSGSAGETEFDAISGATETSRALERILNSGFARYSAAVGFTE